MALTLPNTLVNNTIADADEVMANFDYLLALSDGLPEGTLINGRLDVAVATNNITVRILTDAGAVPSTSDPSYIKIGAIWYTIDSALSVTKNAGTNYGNAGGSELATKEIDWFTYIILRTDAGKPTTNSNLDIGFSRICHGRVYSDFSSTTTNEKYLALGTAGTPTATDNAVNIGRFAATLSATASFNWSVPTFTQQNLIHTPIFETRWLDFVVTPSGSGSMGYGTITDTNTKYKIARNRCKTVFNFYGTTTGSASNEISFVWPFTPDDTGGYRYVVSIIGEATYVGLMYANTTKWTCRKHDNSNWGIGASRGFSDVIEYGI